MKFEEQFPSIRRTNYLCSTLEYMDGTATEMIEELAIWDNCLDKQKVREIIEKYFLEYDGLPMCKNLGDGLKENLGLE